MTARFLSLVGGGRQATTPPASATGTDDITTALAHADDVLGRPGAHHVIDRARAIHGAYDNEPLPSLCPECRQLHPCTTVRALEEGMSHLAYRRGPGAGHTRASV